MTLLEIAEPVFQYICRLNRSARRGSPYELAQVQSDIKILLTEARNKAVTENLATVWDGEEGMELVLMGMIDVTIKESQLPWAGEWRALTVEQGEISIEDKFFDLLEATLKDKSPVANAKLTIFYTCLGLGFTGAYVGQPEFLRRKMKEIAARLQAAGLYSDAQRICADAYEKVDTRDLIEPPGTKLLGIAILLFGMMVVLFFTYLYLYHDSASSLKSALGAIHDQAQKIKEGSK